VLSYEGPFGVGYGVAVLYDAAQDRSGEFTTGNDLPRLARRVVESALAGRGVTPPAPSNDYLAQQAGVFVTIKTAGGKLRGCIGSLETPQMPDILQETCANAIGAAFRDPRFPQVTAIELHNLRFEVSVLHSFEPVDSPAALEPKTCGVIVRTADGRRATLLPGLVGIDTAEQQFRIVCEKGGINPAEPVSITRYRVDKFKEPGCPD
jgi:AmmeMemoRadiSam system protein A